MLICHVRLEFAIRNPARSAGNSAIRAVAFVAGHRGTFARSSGFHRNVDRKPALRLTSWPAQGLDAARDSDLGLRPHSLSRGKAAAPLFQSAPDLHRTRTVAHASPSTGIRRQHAPPGDPLPDLAIQISLACLASPSQLPVAPAVRAGRSYRLRLPGGLELAVVIDSFTFANTGPLVHSRTLIEIPIGYILEYLSCCAGRRDAHPTRRKL